ncbi:hypothetical protein AK812_SmicGene43821 [Symbiodinium microadriaticum]|uniref:Uncharacterized protein n=1 Tax=Symbiodinium microadriaticum TaxID=2951 RepID=A0A1Q9C012_SYMMI|nr:hypothetical protein AK812_SmicGene43821 [Symbiodinium microadriaticum]
MRQLFQAVNGPSPQRLIRWLGWYQWRKGWRYFWSYGRRSPLWAPAATGQKSWAEANVPGERALLMPRPAATNKTEQGKVGSGLPKSTLPASGKEVEHAGLPKRLEEAECVFQAFQSAFGLVGRLHGYFLMTSVNDTDLQQLDRPNPASNMRHSLLSPGSAPQQARSALTIHRKFWKIKKPRIGDVSVRLVRGTPFRWPGLESAVLEYKLSTRTLFQWPGSQNVSLSVRGTLFQWLGLENSLLEYKLCTRNALPVATFGVQTQYAERFS